MVQSGSALGPMADSYEHSHKLQSNLQDEEITAQRTLRNIQSSPSTCDTCNRYLSYFHSSLTCKFYVTV
jgi:hypothetical protein